MGRCSIILQVFPPLISQVHFKYYSFHIMTPTERTVWTFISLHAIESLSLSGNWTTIILRLVGFPSFYLKDRYHSISYRTSEKKFLTILPLIVIAGKNSVSGSAHAVSSPEDSAPQTESWRPHQVHPIEPPLTRSRAMTTNLWGGLEVTPFRAPQCFSLNWPVGVTAVEWHKAPSLPGLRLQLWSAPSSCSWSEKQNPRIKP